MTDQLTPQTQRQHAIAQDAGNAAYSDARKRGDKSAQCYAAYRTAYQASLAEQQAAQVSAAELEADLELTRRIWRETPADEKGY